ncbi:MAG: glycosyltransferase [Elusimicrobia bacterium]|nr:glycosyltransferase [Elusimicrobiota bacterium]
MSRPRVLLVTKLYHPWIGGVERHVQDLAENLKEKGYDVKVLCCEEPRQKGSEVRGQGSENKEKNSFTHPSPLTPHPLIISNIPVYKAPSLGICWSMPVSLTFPFWLSKLAREADIIHFHLPFPLAVLSYWPTYYLLPTTYHPRLILTWHSDVVRQKIADALLRPWTRWFLKKAGTILVSSKNLLESSRALKSWKSKCRVIPMGIRVENFILTPPVKRASERILEENEYKFLLLFVGRLIPYKGLEHLIKAITLLPAQIKLIVIGDGAMQESLKGQAAGLGLTKRVLFLNGLSGADLVAYYHACDLFVLSSVTNNEAFGLVQIEAMASGKPVINTWLATGVPEVSLDGETGLTVRPADPSALAQAVEKLFKNEELRKRLGQNALKRAHRYFSLKETVSQIEAAYNRLAQ